MLSTPEDFLLTAPFVKLWTGRESRALREANRMSIRSFAARLGVSERMISKWEVGGDRLTPRPVNQAALDELFSACDPEIKARFSMLVREHGDPARALFLETAQQMRHPIDGKLMVLIDAGVFLCGPADEPVFLPAFWIDVYPTTNADYARFVAATGHPVPEHWQQGSVPPAAILDHPVVWVSWNDAAAYAAWSAKSLPSSRQWEKSARGARGDIYPWGSQLTPAKANVRESGMRRTTPVDRYHSGASPYGVYDLCGNTWEWCSTRSADGRYELKGSAFTSPFFRCTPSTFNDAAAEMLDDDTGFRCTTARF